MTKPRYILLNFLHGNGPYLRTLELALAVNDELEARGKERMHIIVPLIYGSHQQAIMEENFKGTIEKSPNEILLSEELGRLLKPIFYTGEKSYEESLRYFAKESRATERVLRECIECGFSALTFGGETRMISKKDIAMEINRCPQVSTGISPSYYTGFDYISKVLEHTLKEDSLHGFDQELLKTCIPLYKEIERNQTLHFIAEPSIFSYLGERQKKYPTEITTPPNTNQPHFFHHSPDRKDVEEGVYVTVTGIPGLEHLFEDVQKMGLRVYTHRPELIPGSLLASPHIVADEKIKFHFARSGWGSLWLSFLTDTPFVTRPYHPHDDVEIYFNNKCIENLGIGMVFDKNSTVEDLFDYAVRYKKSSDALKEKLIAKYGTLDGVHYTAQKIVDHFVAQ